MELQNKAVIFIGELRKSLRVLGIGVLTVTIAIFFLTPDLLRVVQHHLAEKLYFFSVAGPFLAHV
ncbi:MAG: preprotein translocase subunit TatC, partial [Proteobacteria bacterium]|nr:preprotein translocase subunit TatC [Pseudomonadota bacterium]